MYTTQHRQTSARALALFLALTLALGCAGTAFAADGALSPSDVYANNVNSAVGITTSITTNYYGFTTNAAASGSGFVYSEDGYIVTNYHVIDDSSSITVSTYDGKSYKATVVGCDAKNDIAVLKIDAEGLQAVTLGDSDALRVGDSVFAIGNPLGELTFSLTMGIVSAVGRQITLSSGTMMDLIQTDAAINSGNSGGPLFNDRGEVVGITNAKYSGSGSGGTASIDNIGFAIPINLVRGIVDSIIEYGYIVKPYLGVTVSSVSEELQGYGIPQGASVQAVAEGSPAEKAGLQVKDIITAVNGTELTSHNDLVRFVASCTPGDELTLTVYRPGESGLLSLAITVGEQQQEATTDVSPAPSESESNQDIFGQIFGPSFSFPMG